MNRYLGTVVKKEQSNEQVLGKAMLQLHAQLLGSHFKQFHEQVLYQGKNQEPLNEQVLGYFER